MVAARAASRLGRVALVGVGAVTALAAAELVLRVGGWAYLAGRVERGTHALDGAAAAQTTILCVGDSFTFGVGAPAGQSYPEQLQAQLLRTRHLGPVQVINRGVPGDNSFQTLGRLRASLAASRPHLVLILTGTNNGWNRTGARGRAWLASLRLVRLVRFARAGWARAWGTVSSAEPAALPGGLLGFELEPAAAEAVIARLRRRDPSREREFLLGTLYLERRRFDEAGAVFERMVAGAPESAPGYVGLAAIAMYQGDPAGAAPWIRRAREVDPHDALALAVEGHWHIMRHDWARARSALRAARQQMRRAPEVEAGDDGGSEAFASAWMARVEWLTGNAPVGRAEPAAADGRALARVQDDVRAMARLARMRGAHVILLTYPGGPAGVSEALRWIGAEQALPLIDLQRAFQAVPAAEQEALLAADGSHLNADGYGWMAGRVTERLALEVAQGARRDRRVREGMADANEGG